MALVILICMVLIVLGVMALFAIAGRVLARRLAPPRRRLVTALMALAGAGLGWMLVIATFYEASVWPPPQLRLAIPPGFDAPVVILLEDPRASGTAAWRDSALPFAAAAGEMDVPPSGIVRIRSFGPMAEHDHVEVIWPDGRPGFAAGRGNFGPPGTGASAFLIVEPPDAPSPGAPQSSDPASIAAYIEQRERPR